MPTRSIPAVEKNDIHMETHRLYLNCLIRYLDTRVPQLLQAQCHMSWNLRLGFQEALTAESEKFVIENKILKLEKLGKQDLQTGLQKMLQSMSEAKWNEAEKRCQRKRVCETPCDSFHSHVFCLSLKALNRKIKTQAGSERQMKREKETACSSALDRRRWVVCRHCEITRQNDLPRSHCFRFL